MPSTTVSLRAAGEAVTEDALIVDGVDASFGGGDGAAFIFAAFPVGGVFFEGAGGDEGGGFEGGVAQDGVLCAGGDAFLVLVLIGFGGASSVDGQ